MIRADPHSKAASKATVERFVQEIDARRGGHRDLQGTDAGGEARERETLERLERLWSLLGEQAAGEQLAARSLNARQQGPRAYPRWGDAEEEAHSTAASGWRLAAAILVSITLLAGSYAYLREARTSWASAASPAQTFSTAASQTQRVMLADGTQIMLGAKTQIVVRYSARRREVELQRGEALFSAATNPSRPFVVIAGAGSITALGTEFDVTRDDNLWHRSVRVVVKEGAVEVGPPPDRMEPPTSSRDGANPKRWIPARVGAGEGLSYDPNGSHGSVVPVDGEAACAWLQGRLEYRHTPLRYVFSDVSRYADKQFVLADESAGDEPFTGIIRLDQVGAFLEALPSLYPVDITESAGEVVIRSRRAPTKS